MLEVLESRMNLCINSPYIVKFSLCRCHKSALHFCLLIWMCVAMCYCSMFPRVLLLDLLSTLITLTLKAFIVTMYASHVTIKT